MHRLHLCTSASWYIFLAKKAGANGECQQQVLQTKTCRRVVQDFPTESFTLKHIGIWWTQCGACPSSGMRWYSMQLPYLEKACLSAVYIIWHFLYLPSFLALQFVSLLLDLCRCRSPGRLLCRSQNPASGWSEQSDPAVIFQSPPSAKTRSRLVSKAAKPESCSSQPCPPHLCSYSPDSRRLGLLHFFLLPLKFPLLGLPEVPFWHFHLTCFIKMTPNKVFCRAQNCWAPKCRCQY